MKRYQPKLFALMAVSLFLHFLIFTGRTVFPAQWEPIPVRDKKEVAMEGFPDSNASAPVINELSDTIASSRSAFSFDGFMIILMVSLAFHGLVISILFRAKASNKAAMDKPDTAVS